MNTYHSTAKRQMPPNTARAMDNQNTMTESELQEEAGIINLACGQLGNELAQGRLQVAANVHRQLGAILKKFAVLETVASERVKANGHAEPDNMTEQPLGR